MKLKNNTQVEKVWAGMTIQPGAYYTPESLELSKWQTSDEVIESIAIGDLIVNDGSVDLVGTSTQVDYLKGNQVRGVQLASPFASTAGFFARFKGVSGIAAPGVATNIDHAITSDRYINGVRLILQGAAWGDSIDLQVVHPAGVVLNEFGSSWYVDASNPSQGDVTVAYPAKVPAGLVVRLVYNSTGETPVLVFANLFLHMKV